MSFMAPVLSESFINVHNADGTIVPIDRVTEAIPVTNDQRPVFVALKTHVGLVCLRAVGTFLDEPNHLSMPR